MSQVAIREYDAKTLFADYTKTPYDGHLIDITNKSREQDFLTSPIAQSGKSLVVKPDMLFGKRGKYGLVGVKLSPQEVVTRVREKSSSSTTIKEKSWLLTIFLVEYFVPHTAEYYIAIKTDRDHDILMRSETGGMDVEDNRDSVKTIEIALWSDTDRLGDIGDDRVQKHIGSLLNFFRRYGFVYLEVNPFCLDESGNLVNLDMVAKVDNCESFKQPAWKTITRTKAFGEDNYPAEDTVKALDEKTGASLKLSIINPHGRIRLLLGWGGASVITMDTLANAWLLDQVANYGELSGNPDYDSNKAYIEQILSMMAKNATNKQYLCLIGGIANFTRIDHLCQAFVKVLEENIDIVKKKNIHIICRRGGVNDTQGLALVKNFCEQHTITCQIFDGSTYLTEWVKELKSL